MNIYNLKITESRNSLQDKVLFYTEKGATVELKEVKFTRTSQQNRALHLFFKQVSEQLNEVGIYFVYFGLKGQEIEIPWTKELFKEMTWKPIQAKLFGTKQTRQLKRDQIDSIFDVLCNWFAEKGIEITFPNSFDYYLKFYEK